MKPIRTFLQQNAIKFWLKAEKPVYNLTKGKHARNLFLSSLEIPYVGSKVKVIKETPTSTFIGKFNDDGTFSDEDFKLLNATDLHMDRDYDLNDKTLQLFVNQIRDEKPDLVILTGDCILAKYQQIDAIQFARMMEELGVYWTYVFGNHEVREEKGFYKYLLMKSISDSEYCLAKHGPEELFGYGNYTVNILGSDGKVRETLFFLDSGRDIIDSYRAEYGVPDEYGSYDFLKKEQIEFYKNEIDSLRKENGDVPSMMYMHIPIPEYANAFEGEEGIFKPTGKCEILYGEQYESVGCSKFNSGMFDAILEKGSTKAVFSGHDHINDWCAIYKGVYLTYNLPQDYNLYHLGNKYNKPEEEWIHGVTVTTLHKAGSFTIEPRYNRIYL